MLRLPECLMTDLTLSLAGSCGFLAFRSQPEIFLTVSLPQSRSTPLLSAISLSLLPFFHPHVHEPAHNTGTFFKKPGTASPPRNQGRF